LIEFQDLLVVNLIKAEVLVKFPFSDSSCRTISITATCLVASSYC